MKNKCIKVVNFNDLEQNKKNIIIEKEVEEKIYGVANFIDLDEDLKSKILKDEYEFNCEVIGFDDLEECINYEYEGGLEQIIWEQKTNYSGVEYNYASRLSYSVCLYANELEGIFKEDKLLDNLISKLIKFDENTKFYITVSGYRRMLDINIDIDVDEDLSERQWLLVHKVKEMLMEKVEETSLIFIESMNSVFEYHFDISVIEERLKEENSLYDLEGSYVGWCTLETYKKYITEKTIMNLTEKNDYYTEDLKLVKIV